MITTKRYSQLKRKLAAFEVWRNGRNGYNITDVPAHLRVSNRQRSSVEVYEFVHSPPKKMLCYVRRNLVGPGVVDRRVEVTTWTGQIIGYGHLGRMYRCGRSDRWHNKSLRYPIEFDGINNCKYRGTYYMSAGDYARVRRVK